MALSVTEQAIFDSLRNTLVSERTDIDRLNEIYQGVARLAQLGLAIPPELQRFTVMLDWGRTTVGAVETRLDVTGFRMPSTGTPDQTLWDVWQYNNMDERQTFAHTDALALKRSYVCVGTNPDDSAYPIITVESPREMIAARDPRTHRVTCALRLYGDQDQYATLYLPNRTVWLVKGDNGLWVDQFEPDMHNLGAPPVHVLVNRNSATWLPGRITEGTSEMDLVIPISDSASRAVTNTQLLQETMVAPARGILGATKGDFVDQAGNPVSAWQAYFGAFLASGNAQAKTFQFDAADTANVTNLITMYGRLASGATGLPIEYFGVNTENPPSADGQRAGETRLIKNAERKQVGFGHTWESVMRTVLRFKTGVWDDEATRMETVWRDAGTPTVGMTADAVVKEFQAGLTDWETAQELLGRTPAQIEVMKRRREADLQLGGVQAQNFVDQAQNLQ